jgi:hypothetical protein
MIDTPTFRSYDPASWDDPFVPLTAGMCITGRNGVRPNYWGGKGVRNEWHCRIRIGAQELY